MSAKGGSGASARVQMPRIGQAMEEGTVIEWHFNDGDRVEEGVPIVSIETDKATYEIEAPASGVLHIVVPNGEEVPVETLIATIGDVPATGATAPSAPAAEAKPATPVAAATGGKFLASPKAKRLAAEHGVDLATVSASAADGVISAEDVERAIAAGPAAKPGPAPTPVAAGPAARAIRERVALTGIRKASARRLQEAWQTIPHIVQMVDADASGLLAERERLGRSGAAVSLNDIILHAAVQAMAANPGINGTVEDDGLLLYEGIDAGLAVDTPRGLMVPVIRGAQALPLERLAAENARLIELARAGHLPAEAVGHASLTVSNLGMFGIRAGTPVINLNEPVLVFVGAIEDRPAVIDGRVVARPALTLSVAFDHRVADGVAAARFTQRLKQEIEKFPSDSSRAAATRDAAAVERPAALGTREIQCSTAGDAYRVEVQSARHSWVLDEPSEAGGTNTGPTPVEAFLGSLVGCMTVSFRAAARRRGVSIERIEGRVAANETRRIETISLDLHVWSTEPEENVRGLLERAERGCFVSAVLKPEIEYKLNLYVHPSAESRG